MEAMTKLTRSMVTPSMFVVPKLTPRKRDPDRSAPNRLAPSNLHSEKSQSARRERFIFAFWNLADSQFEPVKNDSVMSAL